MEKQLVNIAVEIDNNWGKQREKHTQKRKMEEIFTVHYERLCSLHPKTRNTSP
jgi:hypothetical protein